MSNAMTVDVNTTIRRVCRQSWANTLGINLILVHPFGFSCDFRLSWAPTTNSPEAYMSSATSVPLKSCDLTPMGGRRRFHAFAGHRTQFTPDSKNYGAFGGGPPVRRYTRLSFAKDTSNVPPEPTYTLGVTSGRESYELRLSEFGTGIIQPVQRLAVKVYTCSWLINSAWY